MKTLIVNKLSCKYDSDWIFKDISFSIKTGETMMISGPSGSGKTTLAYCLTGIIPHKIQGTASGDIEINKVNIRKLSFQEILRNINIVLQDYNLQIFGLTPEEDIIFSLENRGLNVKKIRETLDEITTKFELDEYRNTPISNLSGGFKQRLSIASTTALKPDFLILDDPAANLDWNGTKKLMNVIKELKDENVGIILITSRLKSFEKIVDKVIYLDNNCNMSPLLPRTNSNNMRGNLENIHDDKEVIEVNNVWFKYNDEYILKNINLKVFRGEIILLMGPNGSGKTTLVKHLNGILKPSKGFVKILGKETRKHTTAELARYIGFVFQDPSRHITRESIWGEATFGCEKLRLSRCKAAEALQRLGLYKYRDYLPYKLSTGEKTRLSIASALAIDPDIIVLDEPTTGQDEATLRILKKIILEIRQEDKAILIVTHDSDLALSIGTRLIVLLDGRIVYDGRPRDILTNLQKTERYGIEPPAYIMDVDKVLNNARKID